MYDLQFYDNTSSDALPYLELGVVAPSTSDDTLLRLGNSSDTFQAEDVTISVEGDQADELWVSLDGDIFTTSVQIGDVPPNSLSAPFWLRRVTAGDAPDGYSRFANVIATPAAWTYTLDTSTSDNVPLYTPDNPPPAD